MAAALLMALPLCVMGQPGRVKTTVQTSKAWQPEIDVRTDAVMVYGPGKDFEGRVASWRERGYKVDFMTGIAWGNYQDYLLGRWDGQEHWDEAQRDINGNPVLHGPQSPYYVPTKNYLEYIKQVVIKPVIDAGIDAIYLEEPEFWAYSGYSEAFKREWQEHYGEPWQPQEESPEATYKSNQLKYHLYYRALDEVCGFAKEYGRQKGLDVKCYVPTHSLLSYTQIRMVSPEASLALLPCVDGYIAQVWTGTARFPNRYRGVRAERVFESAYLEYACMAAMTLPTGRRVWFLTDPVEDWPRDWEDYKRNYEATFTAQLLQPAIADYEVMPWPERIYKGTYPKCPGSDERIRIPADYAVQMQIMTNALNKMPLSENKVSGSQGVSIAMFNSMMFYRFPEHKGYSDPELSSFFGLAMPLVKRGVPVNIVHLEDIGEAGALTNTRILMMSDPILRKRGKEINHSIDAWVKKGGRTLHCSKPWRFTESPEEEEKLVEAVNNLYKRTCGESLEFKNHYRLSRGMYEIAAVMTESISDEPLRLIGRYIDLYDSSLPVVKEKVVMPGHCALLINLDRVEGTRPQVLAASARESDEVIASRHYSLVFKAPSSTGGIARVWLPKKPRKVTVNGVRRKDCHWDKSSHTCLITFNNDPDGVSVSFDW